MVFMDNEKKERLAKVIARAGIASRRDAEKLILTNKVKVNGNIVSSPATNVSKLDKIEVEGKQISLNSNVRIWRYHKPMGLITSHKDPQGRPTVFDDIKNKLPRVISVGRLDLNSEGLLLLTNDGDTARFMENPKTAWKRKYRVRVHGNVTEDIIEKISKGIMIKNVYYAPAEVILEKKQRTNNWLLVTIKEGKNREIRKIMEFFGLKVTRLIRIAYGPFQLGNLQKGEIKEIPSKVIREQLGIENKGEK